MAMKKLRTAMEVNLSKRAGSGLTRPSMAQKVGAGAECVFTLHLAKQKITDGKYYTEPAHPIATK
jgi:hypothetical protein